jgi:ornithine cyclodeaminase/alanine dehydrogenase-like protein (mu-crystallin family)
MPVNRPAAPIAEPSTARQTLVLSRGDIAQGMHVGDYIDAVEVAFGLLARQELSLPPVVYVPGERGGFHVKSAGYRIAPHYVAVKVNGNFPDNPRTNGLPTIQGIIVLADGSNGFPLAVMDSTEVTAQRTAAASAVAAKYLARADARIATIIGCGVQGVVQLRAINHVYPLTKVFAFDIDPARSRRFAGDMSAELQVEVEPLDDFARGTFDSQIVVTCTTARRWFLATDHIAPGTFVAAVGADHHEKQEIDPRLMAGSKVIADVLDQCEQIGDLHHAIDAGVMTRYDVHAELAEIVSGTKPGRTADEQIFIFDSTGSAIQDVAAAGMIYERALQRSIGSAVSLA